MVLYPASHTGHEKKRNPVFPNSQHQGFNFCLDTTPLDVSITTDFLALQNFPPLAARYLEALLERGHVDQATSAISSSSKAREGDS